MRTSKFLGLLLLVVLALVHFALPAIVENTQNKVVPHSPYRISDAALKLHAIIPVADLHSDALLWKRDLNSRSSRGHVDFPRLRAGNVALQVFTAVTKVPRGQNYERNSGDSDSITLLALAQLWPPATWSSLFERTLYQSHKLRAFAAADPDHIVLVRNALDLHSVLAARREGRHVTGALFGIEGAHPLEGDIGKLDALYDAGLRVIGLVHFFDNELGGSLHGENGAGLTPFGREVVKKANDKGIVIDIAHASSRMVRDVLDLSARPVILSHGGIRGACDSPRNLDDALMKEIAAHGGLVGIGFWDGAVCDISPKSVAHAIREAVELLGAEHVALGSDYDGTVETTFDSSELPVLTQELLDAGVDDTTIRRVMGENAVSFFFANLPSR